SDGLKDSSNRRADTVNSSVLASPDVSRPLCVDLDGTLIKSDSLFDALCELARRNPLALFRAPFWVLEGGRAGLKVEVARRAPLDPARLPYNVRLLRYLEAQWREGRPLYLATGADTSFAERVSGHLGIFQGVLGTSGNTNLTSKRKLARLQSR